MLLLALDTSTRQSSVALCTEDALLGEYTWNTTGNHSVELLGHIQRLCVEAHISLPQLDAVVVATGPGSFNGVRVALATGKALAFALKKSLIGISTLDCIAAQQQQWSGPLCALLEAGRGELYSACYTFDREATDTKLASYQPRQLGNYVLLPVPEIVAHIQVQTASLFPSQPMSQPWLLCGEISEASRLSFGAVCPEQWLFSDAITSIRHASVLATLGLLRLSAGELDDPLLLEPFYLRRPSITKSVRKLPLFGAGIQQSGEHDTEREEGALRH